MDIYNALHNLSGFIDMVADSEAFPDEVIYIMNEAEAVITKYVKEHDESV